VIENRIFEGTNCLKAALSSGVTSLQVMIASARSVSKGEHEAVTSLYLIPWPSCLTYRVKTQDSKRIITDHNPHCHSRQLSVLPLMFLKSVYILSGCPVINICSCHQDRVLS